MITGVDVIDIAAKGMVIGKKDGEAMLISGAVPGDRVTVLVHKSRKGMKEGRVKEIEKPSTYRTEPQCQHFDFCGGCNWQNLDYMKQTSLKADRVTQQIKRIAGLSDFESLPIMKAAEQYRYRNKLEFTFVANRWLTPDELHAENHIDKGPGLGFHVPGRFDWVLHIESCLLQDQLHNAIRNFIFEKALELGISFYHPRHQEGTLRNIVLRNNRKGQWMLLIIVKGTDEKLKDLCAEIGAKFAQITSLWIVENNKVNDSYSDCPMKHISGDDHLVESLTRLGDDGQVDYKIGPKSFFQTNTSQAERLYQTVCEWADIKAHETVYDLYTGTGSIALYIANKAKKVVGIEYVPEAIADAKENAKLNGISNCVFYAGDMKDVLNKDFLDENGKPDILVTDPPRAGMHADVVSRILDAKPKRIIYVSCDPATQARDIALLKSEYKLLKIMPVDMFPHTSHVENVALLELIHQPESK